MRLDPTLVRIQELMRRGEYEFSVKARLEMQAEVIGERDVVQSILNAASIYKSVRSTSPRRRRRREYLHIIVSPDSTGTMLYTKGKITNNGSREIYYLF